MIFFSPFMLKLHSRNGIMRSAFHFHHFTKTKFLMFYFLTGLQIGSITGYKISGRYMFNYF